MYIKFLEKIWIINFFRSLRSFPTQSNNVVVLKSPEPSIDTEVAFSNPDK